MSEENWNEEEQQDFKPQVKAGWGMGPTSQVSNIGMNKKTNAASYWDNKTTELVIPEIDVEGAIEDTSGGYQVAEPPKIEQSMANLRELDKDLALNVSSITQEGIDISLLTQIIRPIADLIETDINWEYLSLQAEIG